jgi:DNA-directed RNA polymerase alpha subunit
MKQNIDVRTYFSQHDDSESNISVRSVNALIKGGINTMDELCAADIQKIKKIRNLGDKCLEYVLMIREKYMLEINKEK